MPEFISLTGFEIRQRVDGRFEVKVPTVCTDEEGDNIAQSIVMGLTMAEAMETLLDGVRYERA